MDGGAAPLALAIGRHQGIKVPAARLKRFSLPSRAGLPRLHPSFDDIEEIGFRDAQVAKPRPGVGNEPIEQQAIGGDLAFARPFELGVEAKARRGVKISRGVSEGEAAGAAVPAHGDGAREAQVKRGVGHHIDEGRSRGQNAVFADAAPRFRRSRSADDSSAR
ncbi:MAG: hypothetical protein FD148_1911 [Methylocystaceae bacterium]|nr:MAG: hypothetical protein FD148_1911 [Methylocystaceae bacterium]